MRTKNQRGASELTDVTPASSFDQYLLVGTNVRRQGKRSRLLLRREEAQSLKAEGGKLFGPEPRLT